MQQEISAEKNADIEAVKAAKEEDSQIWARQNFILGCDDFLVLLLLEEVGLVFVVVMVCCCFLFWYFG